MQRLYTGEETGKLLAQEQLLQERAESDRLRKRIQVLERRHDALLLKHADALGAWRHERGCLRSEASEANKERDRLRAKFRGLGMRVSDGVYDGEMGTMPDSAISKLSGSTVQTVRNRRNKLGIKPFKVKA